MSQLLLARILEIRQSRRENEKKQILRFAQDDSTFFDPQLSLSISQSADAKKPGDEPGSFACLRTTWVLLRYCFFCCLLRRSLLGCCLLCCLLYCQSSTSFS